MRETSIHRTRIDALRRELAATWAAPAFDLGREQAALAGLREELSGGRVMTGVMEADRAIRSGEDRRFTDKPTLNPGAVRSLPAGHPALVKNRTLFPTTVVDVTEDFSDRLLVSGKNNRKLGERIEKGAFKGYALYGLSLEERATCPTDCDARAYCYGNGMQMARRHRIVNLDLFAGFLEAEITTILADPVDGLLVRLHVLGDFPSVEYVALWSDLLDEFPKLACYGYTHRSVKGGGGGDDIGDAIDSVKGKYPDRFRIRWSWPKPLPDGAYVINHVPNERLIKNHAADALVCPAQTDATACCASCGLCWEPSARGKAIAFIKHGPKSLEAEAASAVAKPEPIIVLPGAAPPQVACENVRPVSALKVAHKRAAVLSEVPDVRVVAPTDLKVESAYQRDLSGKSMKLIRRIVTGWDWAKFKPPVCAETPEGLFVIDGQHTAIAAASHPEIDAIPVMVVSADRMERRAEAFVSHNRDRLTMTAAQILYGDAAAGRKDAVGALAAVERAGATVPRLPVSRGYAKPGQITAISELRTIFSVHGADFTERAVRIAALSRIAPVSKTVLGAIRYLISETTMADIATKHDRDIASALTKIKNIEAAAQAHALETGQGRVRAAAMLAAAELRSAA